MFTPDIANRLLTLPNVKRFDVSIGAGEQRTNRIDANRGDPQVDFTMTPTNPFFLQLAETLLWLALLDLSAGPMLIWKPW